MAMDPAMADVPDAGYATDNFASIFLNFLTTRGLQKR